MNNLMRAAGVPLVDAWRAASHNPAAAIGELHRIGQLLPGRRGDVLIAQADDSHLDLRQVWLGGELVKDEG
ncbi:hypothetical protein G7085_12040 [Tessaracoccus sp. HDW20]|uniref:hypothetical protein n=1 Tax=Tessaracoccus coleopterorum TaxID=2714950 RepID=UPI0018D476F2|nr:hypothetical protein [Tessaracoccus coleopterorum]NHB85099.1 hypothetical protein [Tessaracoccus coleopterorum]